MEPAPRPRPPALSPAPCHHNLALASAKGLRTNICDTIISVSQVKGSNNASPVELGAELDKIFASYFEEKQNCPERNDVDEDDDNVTPLMVACDKCCSEALCYLQNQARASASHEFDNNLPPQAISLGDLAEAWGHPTEQSSCGNTAAHHAMAAGFVGGLDALEQLWGYFEEIEWQNGDRLHRYISLLSQTNQNGDTPLMMACVSGHTAAVKHILEHSLELGLGADDNDHDLNSRLEKIQHSLADAFCVRNNEEFTALNLACGHSHIDIVRFLVESQHIQVIWGDNSFAVTVCKADGKGTHKKSSNVLSSKTHHLKQLVGVTYADLDFCKETIENLAAGLNFMKKQNQKEKIMEFGRQHQQASECLLKLQCELERRAAVTASELLMLEGGDDKTNKPATPKKRKPKKKKKQKRTSISRKQEGNLSGLDKKEDAGGDNTVVDDGTRQRIWATTKDEPDNLTLSPFITLPDGSLVSKAQKSQFSSTIKPGHSPLDDVISDKPAINKTNTLQSILESSASPSISPSSAADSDMAAVMDSLCLEPSMLLLSPHGMAMEMSPCQLDAIEAVLSHQLKSTKEAQIIQSRLLDKNTL